MWILNTAGGDSIYVFDNMLEGLPWKKSRYLKWFDEMENQQEDRWHRFPILATGIETALDEAVSIAVRSYASPSGAPVKYHTLIAARFPGKLLERNAKGACAHDINGMHPDDLAGQSPFPTVHRALWEIMWEKNWVCWNTDFDVALLDSLCLRHGLPLIPRKRVVCAMRRPMSK